MPLSKVDSRPCGYPASGDANANAIAFLRNALTHVQEKTLI
ncbi:hypothetical protein NIES267_50970 [Calothrix parasitica NIES-267]|uniref:Uncharacterized protein n=1 Tax=Calothrix parasitica NIES-267 TaxID=1973488 RepID=A0A1Z4LWG4_9CYAN|nr:hypothetical protein NIES267_50970 [Calothrix parasitica NIES-267]